MRGHSRSKDGVASLAYPRASILLRRRMDCRVKPGNDYGEDLNERNPLWCREPEFRTISRRARLPRISINESFPWPSKG
jgi:hypothetical protein